MEKAIRIVKDMHGNQIINESGNLRYDGYGKSNLQDSFGYGNIYSRDYYHMEQLDDEHYIVTDVISDATGLDVNSTNLNKLKLMFKQGIIRLAKNNKGNINPMAEEVVVPIAYDSISPSNSHTVIACGNNGLYTYIDLDPQSENYGKQLVPVMLTHAIDFDIPYEGFAECGINGVTGYLPRSCKPKEYITASELLTKEQVEFLLPFLNGDELFSETVEKLSNLTGGAKVLQYKKTQ